MINRNMSLTAVFEPVGREYTVSFESENSNYGKVSTSSFKANYGEKIKIVDNMIVIGNSSVIAIANDRTVQYEYSFAGWKMKNGSAVGTTVDGAMTIVATFAQTERTYTVTLAVNNAELGTIENYTLPIAATYGAKIKVEDYKITIGETTYIATPADGYTFEKWTGIVGSVNGNITITAVFSTAGDWAAVKFDMQEGVLISGFDGNVMFVPNGESVEISGTTIKIGETTITVAVNDGYRIIELESSTGTINGSVTITIEAVKVCEVRVKLDGHYGFEEFETIYVESGTIVSQKDSTDPVLTIGEHEFYATYIEWNVNRVSINGNTVSSIDGYVITDDVTIIVDLYISLA